MCDYCEISEYWFLSEKFMCDYCEISDFCPRNPCCKKKICFKINMVIYTVLTNKNLLILLRTSSCENHRELALDKQEKTKSASPFLRPNHVVTFARPYRHLCQGILKSIRWLIPNMIIYRTFQKLERIFHTNLGLSVHWMTFYAVQC